MWGTREMRLGAALLLLLLSACGDGDDGIDPPPSTTSRLTVSILGAGARVQSSPAGIDCPSLCEAAFERGTVVTLSVVPANGVGLESWTGACSGGGACNITMVGNLHVQARLGPVSGSEPGPEPGAGPQARVVDGDGSVVTQVSPSDPVLIQVFGLTPNTRHFITVTGPDGVEISPAGGYSIQSDEDGRIPSSTVVQNLDLAAAAATVASHAGTITPKLVTPGRYTVQLLDRNHAPVTAVPFDVIDGRRLYCADATGAARGSFAPGQTVYARIESGGAPLPDGTYPLYVLSDLGPVLANNDGLGSTSLSANLSGGAALAELGSYATGVYDVVLDVNRNGRFESDTDLVARRPRLNPCFTIQQPAPQTPAAIVGQICSDSQGNYRDSFDPTVADPASRDMFAYITPERRPAGGDVLAVDKYVVQHKDAWNQGDALQDLTAGFETDPVQGFCTNEAPWLVWPRQLFQPGCYDVIIDINRNGLYDVGTDFLDNIDNSGRVSCGCRVASASCADRITITAPQPQAVIEASSTAITGSVTGSPQRGYVTIVSGGQTSTVSLNLSGGTFDGRVPLFRDQNLLTVTFEYADGSACSRTLGVTSVSAQAATLIRAQLTWDGDSDADLHLIRPDLSFGGYFTDDDCHFANCEVGLDGSMPNELDWGIPGEADDPKLDVDCIACGVGIENIYMTQVPEDGDYEVVVDQFAGDEDTNVVTIFIRETQVGQVACPPLESEAADTCRIGVVRWTNGNGQFIPDDSPGIAAISARSALVKPAKPAAR